MGNSTSTSFYRPNVVPLAITPLRERLADVPLRVAHFLETICRAEHLPLKHATAEAIERLMLYDWPANIRQLENVVECAVALNMQLAADMLRLKRTTLAAKLKTSALWDRPLVILILLQLTSVTPLRYDSNAGWSSLVARWAHNPKVVGSNPTPATKPNQIGCAFGPKRTRLPKTPNVLNPPPVLVVSRYRRSSA